MHSDSGSARSYHLSDTCKRQISHTLEKVCYFRSLTHDLVSHYHDLCRTRYKLVKDITSLMLRILSILIFIVPLDKAELAESGYPEGYAAGGIVSNDDGVPGVVDATCGEAFRAAFGAADLVVAKGQANFETMNERTDKPIAFLFLAKCPVVCRAIGAAAKTIQVLFAP